MPGNRSVSQTGNHPSEGATALVDGHNAMGMVSACYGTEVGIRLAREYGSSTVSITGSNHLAHVPIMQKWLPKPT
ncbi:Ldh family oxidoreductase [Clostridium sp. AM58-1XD]|uniref:Ldh family oxidoreductase n=1 Tax=Clostridium sp. AM58-1XD TaxID=2292307 RepID=UPI000E540128|nr:Ldh family oxidoreductase [Clostridium sp. AM58-1XD]RGY96279.1 hypothetical protein DXA13_17485 [Clostridium sp. AM58-1XD]